MRCYSVHVYVGCFLFLFSSFQFFLYFFYRTEKERKYKRSFENEKKKKHYHHNSSTQCMNIVFKHIAIAYIIYKHYWQCIFYSFACFVALSYTVPFQIVSKYWSIAHLISYLCFYLWLLLLYFIFLFRFCSCFFSSSFFFICFIRLKFSTISSYSSTNQLVSTSDVCFVRS